jgi:hypothetical protein
VARDNLTKLPDSVLFNTSGSLPKLPISITKLTDDIVFPPKNKNRRK